MRHRSALDDDDDDDEESDGFISGTPAKPRSVTRGDLMANAKRAISNPMVIAGIVIIVLLWWRPWGGSAAAVQGLPKVESAKSMRAAADDDVVVVDSSVSSSTRDDDDDGDRKVSAVRAGGGSSSSDDVVVVDSSASSVVNVVGDTTTTTSSTSGGSSSTTTAVVSSSSSTGEVVTTVHAVDEFGTPPPSPPPRRAESSLEADRKRAQQEAERERAKPRVDPKKLDAALKNLEEAMNRKTAPKGEELASMLAQCEKLFHDARSDDVSFEQRQRLKAVEQTIQKAHKGSHLVQKLAEGEYLMRTGGAQEELRAKMKEIELAIKDAGPQIDNHPHIKDQLEKQLDEIDKRLEEKKASDAAKIREEHEKVMRARREDPLRRDRDRAHKAAERQQDIRGGAPAEADEAEADETSESSEAKKLREKIDRLQREGGDDLVLSALREKLVRLEQSGNAAPKGRRRAGPGLPTLDDVGREEDVDGDGEPEVVVVGKKRKTSPRAGKRLRGIFRGGASAEATVSDEVETRRPSRAGRKGDDDSDEEEE